MKFRHVLAAVLLPLALVAAGCTDDEDSATDSDATATTAAASSSGDAEADAEQAEVDASTTAASADALPMGTPISGDTAQFNIAQIATGTPAVSTLTQLVILAGLVPTLRDGGPFTVFAPVNDAFAAIPPATYVAVTQDPATLTQVLSQHVVPGTYKTTDLMDLDGQSLTTIDGSKLLVKVDRDNVIVGGATIAIGDIIASNGVIHAVDTVIAEPNGS